MSGECSDCGNVMCLCDSEGFGEDVLFSGVMMTREARESLDKKISDLESKLKIAIEAIEMAMDVLALRHGDKGACDILNTTLAKLRGEGV